MHIADSAIGGGIKSASQFEYASQHWNHLKSQHLNCSTHLKTGGICPKCSPFHSQPTQIYLFHTSTPLHISLRTHLAFNGVTSSRWLMALFAVRLIYTCSSEGCHVPQTKCSATNYWAFINCAWMMVVGDTKSTSKSQYQ